MQELGRQLQLLTAAGVAVLGYGRQLHDLGAHLVGGGDEGGPAGMKVVELLGHLQGLVRGLRLAGLGDDLVLDLVEGDLVARRHARDLDHRPGQGSLDRAGAFPRLEREGRVGHLGVGDPGLGGVGQFQRRRDAQGLGHRRRRFPGLDPARGLGRLGAIGQDQLLHGPQLRLGQAVLLEGEALLQVGRVGGEAGGDLAGGEAGQGDHPGLRLDQLGGVLLHEGRQLRVRRLQGRPHRLGRDDEEAQRAVVLSIGCGEGGIDERRSHAGAQAGAEVALRQLVADAAFEILRRQAVLGEEGLVGLVVEPPGDRVEKPLALIAHPLGDQTVGGTDAFPVQELGHGFLDRDLFGEATVDIGLEQGVHRHRLALLLVDLLALGVEELPELGGTDGPAAGLHHRVLHIAHPRNALHAEAHEGEQQQDKDGLGEDRVREGANLGEHGRGRPCDLENGPGARGGRRRFMPAAPSLLRHL